MDSQQVLSLVKKVAELERKVSELDEAIIITRALQKYDTPIRYLNDDDSISYVIYAIEKKTGKKITEEKVREMMK